MIVQTHQKATTREVAWSLKGLYYELIMMQIPKITKIIELT